MIHVYENGRALVQEHSALLNTNPYLSMFFALDARFLDRTDNANFALMAKRGEDVLLAIRLEPFSTVVFGSAEAGEELVDFWMEQGYECSRLLGDESLCEAITSVFREKYGIQYAESLAMDFMEAREMTEPSCTEVTLPTMDDLDELMECLTNFDIDCGLQERPNRDHTRQRLQEFRILRRDGKIAAMATVGESAPGSLKIAHVYTRPEFRGQSLARKVVNTLKNEILGQGMAAVLNVDKKNPISNHLYRSLGFCRVFSQGEYRRIEK